MAAIALSDVTKQFAGGHAALRGVTVEAADGELLVLVGPSGSGKSTVLRLVAGLETPTSGRITIDGRDVTRVPPQGRDVAMVFQSYALYPHMTVRDNLSFGLRVRGVEAAAIAARVAAAATALGIDALLERKPAQLSGGQRQRVALGRAIVREPKAFLLDEPLSNLDPALRAETRAELGLLHRRIGATMLYVTHDQEEAMTLGTRIAVMRDGIVEQVAPPLEVYARPANAFVAGFVGSPAMNLWRGTCRRGADGVRATGAALALDLPAHVAVSDGSEVTIGVRPHDVSLVDNGAGDGSGVVEMVEPLGPVVLVRIRAGRAGEEIVRTVVPGARGPAVGETVGFRIQREAVHLFEGRGGTRIE